MDIRKLEAFAKVYEKRSFSRAAQDLFVSQPTISAHVSNLEEELDVRLFDRLGRSILPTQAADILYEYAVDILGRLDQARSAVDHLRDKIAGKLVVGCSTIPAKHILPRLLAGFLAKYKDVSIRLVEGSTDEIISRMEKGEMVLAVVGSVPEKRLFRSLKIMEDKLVLVSPPGWSKGAGSATLKDIARWPWIMRETGSGTLKAFSEGLAGAGISMRDLRTAMVVETTETVLKCVRAGIGVSVVSSLAADIPAADGAIDILGPPPFKAPRSFYLIHRRGREFLPAVDAFIGYVTDHGPKD